MSSIFQRSSGIFYLNYSVGRRQVRMSLSTKDPEIARARYAAFMARRDNPVIHTDLPLHFPKRENIPWVNLVDEGCKSGQWLRAMLQRARDRATAKSLPFLLSLTHMKDIALRSGGRCEATGIAFTWGRDAEYRFSPYAPTLDRIKPRLGYHHENCRLIGHAANLALADWGDDVFEAVAIGFLRQRGLIAKD